MSEFLAFLLVVCIFYALCWEPDMSWVEDMDRQFYKDDEDEPTT